jgi:hypothetical protein
MPVNLRSAKVVVACYGLPGNSGSLSIFAAIRRASSLVSSVAALTGPIALLQLQTGRREAAGVRYQANQNIATTTNNGSLPRFYIRGPD